MNKSCNPMAPGWRLCVVCFALAAVLSAGCAWPWRKPAPPVTPAPVSKQQVLYAQAEGQLYSPDPQVRRDAAVMLLSLEDPAGAQAVLKALREGEDARVRVSMIEAIRFCRDRRCFDALLATVRDADPQVQEAAAGALSEFMSPDEIAAITDMLSRPESTARHKELLFGALGEGMAFGAVPAMLKGLESEQEGTKLAAWQALRKISRRDFPPDVEKWRSWWEANKHRTREDILEEHLRALTRQTKALSTQLSNLQQEHQELMGLLRAAASESPRQLLDALGSVHGAAREYASFRLAAMPKERLSGLKLEPRDYAVLGNALKDPSAAVRRNVIRFVVNAGGQYEADLVARALMDESPQVELIAIGAVEPGMAEQVVGRIEELLRSSPSADVREAAANALGKIGSEQSIPVLASALNDAAENVRWFAVEGLRKLHATQAVPRLSELVQNDPSARVREIAATALGELGQPAGVPALRAALSDRSERVRQRAAEALLALATDNYERMAVIAASFQEHGLMNPARQVLTRIIERFGGDPNMSQRMAATYGRLAEVLKAQGDFSAAAEAYAKLDELSGGSPEVRRQMVSCWLAASEPDRAVTAVRQWLQAAAPAEEAEMITLAVDSAELLVASGATQQARAVLDLAASLAQKQADRRLLMRIEKVRRRISQ